MTRKQNERESDPGNAYRRGLLEDAGMSQRQAVFSDASPWRPHCGAVLLMATQNLLLRSYWQITGGEVRH